MDIESLTAFAKRAGLFWPAAEIYGGASGIFDYGHIGAVMKRRFESLWLDFFVGSNDNYHLIDGSTVFPERPLVASGHADRFNDVLVGCSKCNTFYRADVLLADLGVEINEGASAEELGKAISGNNIKCPKCKGDLMEPKAFNMMIDVNLGPDKHEKGYLRPETAQSAYLNFPREYNILRKRLPLGLANIGRAYRNEISPRQGLYRMREMIQAELQIFFDPGNWNMEDADEMLSRSVNVVLYRDGEARNVAGKELVDKFDVPAFYAYHMCLIEKFYTDIMSFPKDKLRFFEKGGKDKAFYNKIHMDIEADVESWNGFKEIGGLHYRGDYDLSSHSKGTGESMEVESDGKKIIPNVLELSFGVDRNVWTIIDMFYTKDGDRKVLKVPSGLAPYAAAVLPLQKDDKIQNMAKEIHSKLKRVGRVYFDEAGSIGRRYARMDEIGTPFCITVDFESVDDKSDNYGTVTVRERDSKSQKRVSTDEIDAMISNIHKGIM